MQIALSSGIRNTLLTIQQTTRAANVSEQRLATGLKVASATDNPLAFFSAAGLRDRASDLAAKARGERRRDGGDGGRTSMTSLAMK